MPRAAAEGFSPCGDLFQFLSRRAEIAGFAALANTAADTLMFAIDGGEPQALARAGELPELRRAKDDANAALTALDHQIAAFPAQGLEDVVIKLRFYADELGHLTAANEADLDEAGGEARRRLSILRYLERLTAADTP